MGRILSSNIDYYEEVAQRTGLSLGALNKIKTAGYEITPKEFEDVGIHEVTNNFIEDELKKLKANEPTSDNKFFRTNIIAYEFGDLCRAIVYANRFKDQKKILFGSAFKDENIILAEGKLAMADMLTQLNMLCLSMEWDFQALRLTGMEHLKERQKDFQRDGWTEVKG